MDERENRVKRIKPVENGIKCVKTTLITSDLLSFHQYLLDLNEIIIKTTQILYWVKMSENGRKRKGEYY